MESPKMLSEKSSKTSISSSRLKYSESLNSLVSNLKTAGATVNKLVGEKLWCSIVTFQDAGWSVYEEWALTNGKDPRVGAVVAPPISIIDTVLSPPDAIYAGLARECNSIIHHYAGLSSVHFQSNAFPDILPPVFGLPPSVLIPHPTIALSHLLTRIQNPPANYPILCGLKSGSYICHVSQTWANVAMDIIVFKP